jgi:hypothetical protein
MPTISGTRSTKASSRRTELLRTLPGKLVIDVGENAARKVPVGDLPLRPASRSCLRRMRA